MRVKVRIAIVSVAVKENDQIKYGCVEVPSNYVSAGKKPANQKLSNFRSYSQHMVEGCDNANQSQVPARIP
jgi:hypothetical protein